MIPDEINVSPLEQLVIITPQQFAAVFGDVDDAQNIPDFFKEHSRIVFRRYYDLSRKSPFLRKQDPDFLKCSKAVKIHSKFSRASNWKDVAAAFNLASENKEQEKENEEMMILSFMQKKAKIPLRDEHVESRSYEDINRDELMCDEVLYHFESLVNNSIVDANNFENLTKEIIDIKELVLRNFLLFLRMVIGTAINTKGIGIKAVNEIVELFKSDKSNLQKPP